MLRHLRMIVIAAVCVSAATGVHADLSAEQEELLRWVDTMQLQCRWDEGLAMCDMIIAADPECAEAYCERGIILLNQEEPERAEQEFMVAVAISPRLVRGYVGRAGARTGLGQAPEAREDAQLAIELCTKALELNQRDADAYYHRGLARRVIGQEADASWDLTRALEIRPEFAQARLERAHIYRNQGKLETAIEHCTRALEARPDYVSAWLTRARAYYQTANYEQALADCTSALEVNPQSARAAFNRGLVQTRAGRVAEGIADFTLAVQLRDDYEDAWFYRAEAYATLGEMEAAKADWRRVVELAPDGWAGRLAVDRLAVAEDDG